jgi:hypothetical protein
VTVPDFVEGTTELVSVNTCGVGGMADGGIYGSDCLEVGISAYGNTVSLSLYGCWSYTLSEGCSIGSSNFTFLGSGAISGAPPDTNVSYSSYDPTTNETFTFSIEDSDSTSVLAMPTPEPATAMFMLPLPFALLGFLLLRKVPKTESQR